VWTKALFQFVYAVINIAHTIIGIPAGILSDKIGKEKVVLMSYCIFAVSSILMVVSINNLSYAYIIAIVFGLYVGIAETVQRAIIPKYVPTELRGTAYGVYSLVTGMCFFVSNITFGFIWNTYDISAAVTYSISMSLSAIIGMIVFIKRYSTLTNTGIM